MDDAEYGNCGAVMDDVLVIIIGIGGWDKFTKPCVQTILSNEPLAKIVVVDNGTNPAYPEIDGARVMRLNETVCYAAAMNTGIRESNPAGRYLLCNNDVLFHKPFVELVKRLPANYITGFYIHKIEKKYEYISSFAWIISRHIWEVVGEFDEQFAPMGYEDADYCLRAKQHGFELLGVMRETLGIEHQHRDRGELSKKLLERLKEKHGL